jgi:beta-phosphoglucomutase-like phosphatase (HAD superfamily)
MAWDRTMQAPLQALIFDVDGTLADTETAHLQAFNAAFAEARLDWCWDEALYTRLLKVAGGKERLDALLQVHFGAHWRTRFAAIGDAGTTHAKKPAPDVYHDVLEQLGLPAAACLAFEDSGNGLLAALGAHVPTIVTPTAYTSRDCFDRALAVLPHLGDPHTPIRPRVDH